MNWVWGQIKSVFQKRHIWVKQNKKAIEQGANEASKTGRKVSLWKLVDEKKFSKIASGSFTDKTSDDDRDNDLETTRDQAREMFEGDSDNESYTAKASEAIAHFAKGGIGSTLKKDFDSVKKEILKNEKTALATANAELKAADNSESTSEASKKVTEAKKNASYKLKKLQIIYGALKRMDSYYFSFCKKCYNYKTFGSRKVKEESASLLDSYMD